MAKSKSSEQEVAKPIELVPVGIDITDENELLKNLPAALTEGAEVYHSDLPPSPSWETPGEYIEGFYLGMKEHIGPNDSAIYSLSVHHKGQNREVAVWGSTSLDERMRLANPSQGDHLIIVYTGETDTAKKKNPLKLFTVILKRKK